MRVNLCRGSPSPDLLNAVAVLLTYGNLPLDGRGGRTTTVANGDLGSHLPNCVVTVVWSGCPTTWALIWSRILPVRIGLVLSWELLVPVTPAILMVYTPSLYGSRAWHSLSPPLSWRFLLISVSPLGSDSSPWYSSPSPLWGEGKGEGVPLILYCSQSAFPLTFVPA